MSNKSLFTRWLRSKQLPLLLSVLLLAAGGLQSLHDQIDHDALGSTAHCEYCLLSQGIDLAVVPVVISVPAELIDHAPELLLALVFPIGRNYRQQARAPPKSFSV